MDRRTLEENRLFLAKTFGVPSSAIILNDNRYFEMYLVKENDKQMIEYRARESGRISMLTCVGNYDFSHPSPFSPAQRIYTIRGRID